MTDETKDLVLLAELAFKYPPQDLARMVAQVYAEKAMSLRPCEVQDRFKSISDAYYLVVARITGIRG